MARPSSTPPTTTCSRPRPRRSTPTTGAECRRALCPSEPLLKTMTAVKGRVLLPPGRQCVYSYPLLIPVTTAVTENCQVGFQSQEWMALYRNIAMTVMSQQTRGPTPTLFISASDITTLQNILRGLKCFSIWYWMTYLWLTATALFDCVMLHLNANIWSCLMQNAALLLTCVNYLSIVCKYKTVSFKWLHYYNCIWSHSRIIAIPIGHFTLL